MSELRNVETLNFASLYEHHANREFQQAVHQGSWWDGIILSDGRKCFAEKTFLPFSGSDGVPSVWLSGTPTVARVTEMYGTRFAEMYARNLVTAREMYARNWVASEWAGGTLTVARVDGFDVRLSITDLSMGRRLPRLASKDGIQGWHPRMHTSIKMDSRFQVPVDEYIMSKYSPGDVGCFLLAEEEAVRVTLWVTHISGYMDSYIRQLWRY
jgi:hypothetical protein